MRPLLLEIGALKFHSYPVALAAAFLLCTLWACRTAQRLNPPVLLTPQAGLWAYLGGILGAKVFYAVQFGLPLWRAFIIWEGGLVFYGGLIGATLGILIHFRLSGIPVLRGGDAAASFLPLGEAITRIGCFLNGCCYGRITTMPWGVCFPPKSHVYDKQLAEGLIDASSAAALSVHPTQLYMSAGLVVVFIALQVALRKKHVDGMVIALYCLLYGVVRFTVEGFRWDSARPVLMMTVSQVISLGLIVAGLTALILIQFNRKKFEN